MSAFPYRWPPLSRPAPHYLPSGGLWACALKCPPTVAPELLRGAAALPAGLTSSVLCSTVNLPQSGTGQRKLGCPRLPGSRPPLPAASWTLSRGAMSKPPGAASLPGTLWGLSGVMTVCHPHQHAGAAFGFQFKGGSSFSASDGRGRSCPGARGRVLGGQHGGPHSWRRGPGRAHIASAGLLAAICSPMSLVELLPHPHLPSTGGRRKNCAP